ncbi:M23 family metallopeptidase [Herbidospora sp. RD11066]
MRPGILALVLVGLTAGCSTPMGVAGVSTRPPEPPVTGQPINDVATPAPAFISAAVPPTGDEPVLLPPPKLSKFEYAFPVKGCQVSYARKLLVLPKTTIWADKGCAFVAPVAGTVREVNVQNRWVPSTDRGGDREGRFVTLLGDDGVLYLGGHLDTVSEGITPGTKVKAGQRLGTIGNTGNARDTASNLYFAMTWKTDANEWWIRRGMVEPWDYLDAWRNGNRTYSPLAEMRGVRKKTGPLPACSIACAAKPEVKGVERPQPTPTKKPAKPVEVGPLGVDLLSAD